MTRASDEDEHERLNRQFDQLLQELRVAMPGVQILFGFLLTVPFAQGFRTVSAFQERVYLATLLLAAVATCFFIAPAAYHRILFEQREKEHIIKRATQMAVLGLASLALAMTGAVVLITDYLFRDATVIASGGGVFALLTLMWFALPILRRIAT